MDVCRRQKEMEEKLIEEEVARRVDAIVKQRVEEERLNRKWRSRCLLSWRNKNRRELRNRKDKR